MDIAFRVDASPRVGFGHLSRCLALADQLAEQGLMSTFVLWNSSEEAVHTVRSRGHRAVSGGLLRSAKGGWEEDVRRMRAVVDAGRVRCVIVDHYELDRRWEGAIGGALEVPVVAIDGVADRPHACDLLVDPTYSEEATEDRWSTLISDRTDVMAGAEYALLRPEFQKGLALRGEFDGRVDQIFVGFGGGDDRGATELAVDALSTLGDGGVRATVVVGGANPHAERLRRRCGELPNLEFHCEVDDMAQRMASADLAVGGGGVMMWERAFLRLPAVVVAVADNQVGLAESVATTGAIRFLGAVRDVDVSQLRDAIRRLMNSPPVMKTMARRNRRVVADTTQVGTGPVAGRIRELIERTSRGERWTQGRRRG